MSDIKLNEQIVFFRKQKGITQEELAQVLGVTNQSISKWESGACFPDIQLLPVLAGFFNVSVDALLGYKPVVNIVQLFFIYFPNVKRSPICLLNRIIPLANIKC